MRILMYVLESASLVEFVSHMLFSAVCIFSLLGGEWNLSLHGRIVLKI